MEHEMKLQPTFFDKIKAGTKIYEVRLFDEKRQKIKVGDTIIFKKEPSLSESLCVQVLDLLTFDSFEALTKTLPLKSVGFDGMQTQDALKIYHSFYSEADEQKFGAIAIKIKVKAN